MKTTQENDASLTGAGIDLMLTDVDGGTIKLVMRPLTDKDLVELDEWVRGKIMDVALLTCRRLKDSAEREDVRRSALRSAAAASFMSGDGRQLIASRDGMARMLWQATKPAKLTEEDLGKLFMVRDNLARVITTFQRFKLPGAAEEQSEEPDPNAERQSAP